MHDQKLIQRAEELEKLVRKASELHAGAGQDGTLAVMHIDAGMEKAWRCGQVLLSIKRIVGHGNWMTFLEANLPAISQRTAQRWMDVARLSPNATTVAYLTEESVRKFRYGYIPEKERPELKGNVEVCQTDASF
jgi:hypothetical protein